MPPLTHRINTLLGSASERAKWWGAVSENSGHAPQHYHDMLLARLGVGEGERERQGLEAEPSKGMG